MKKGEIIVIFLIGISVFTIVHFTNLKKDNNKVVDSSYEVAISDTPSEVVKESSPKEIIRDLQKKYNNSDIVAELRIDNTNYTSVVPQGVSNEYYHRRLPNKRYSLNGSTYLDYRTKINKSRVLIIYGHNSKDYVMPFKILENYYNEDYFKNHKYIKLVTESGIKTYQIFSVFVEPNDFSYYTDIEFNNDTEFYNHISKLKKKSFYDTGVNITGKDNILILQACSTHSKYRKYKHKFVLIISKEVKIDENN